MKIVKEKSTNETSKYLKELESRMGFPIRMIQVDNGPEFVNDGELVLCQEIVQDKKRKFYYPARTSFSLDWLARYNFSNSLGDKYPQ